MFETAMVTGSGGTGPAERAKWAGSALLLHLGAATIYLGASLWSIGTVTPPHFPAVFMRPLDPPAPAVVTFIPRVERVAPEAGAAALAPVTESSTVQSAERIPVAEVQPTEIVQLVEASGGGGRLEAISFGATAGVGSGKPLASAGSGSDAGGEDVLPFDPVRMVAPRILFRVEPTYPELARRVHKSGVVHIEAEIGRDGLLHRARAVNSPLGFGLEAAALEAVASWRFSPALYRGKPVAVLYSLTVQFTLN